MRGFDQWATITGNYRWSYANVEKYFHKMEDYNALRTRPRKLSEAVKESGFSVRDLNARQEEGKSFVKLDSPLLNLLKSGDVGTVLTPRTFNQFWVDEI
ncbi:Oxygen-dependent choline dehydrogenase [Orchesella cincta]|uniref:Oxygen-dependent choline dehydrogenase n=1 Tax=Orchesella cincta TaxID=48709 RepID=A0A1D2MK34_ORCCI|nr:Oxygen-dependent choline dehydrogenase [Orchesella cincta]